MGNTARLGRTLFLSGWGALVLAGEKDVVRETTPAAGQTGEARGWAVLIGVDRYIDPAIPALRYCTSDARLMGDTLAQKCGYDADRILLLTRNADKPHLDPTRANLQQQTSRWLKHAEPHDVVLVYFSGHGFLDDRGQGVLATQDAELSNLGLTALRVDELREMLKQCRARQKFLILDCCHSGGDKSGAAVGNPAADLAAGFKQSSGLVTLASCKSKEKSLEWPEKSQGLFTYFLSSGLSGAADRDRDGVVDNYELYRYVYEKVPVTAQKELNSVQTPVQIIGDDTAGVFALAKVDGRSQPPPERVAEERPAASRPAVPSVANNESDPAPVVPLKTEQPRNDVPLMTDAPASGVEAELGETVPVRNLHPTATLSCRILVGVDRGVYDEHQVVPQATLQLPAHQFSRLEYYTGKTWRLVIDDIPKGGALSAPPLENVDPTGWNVASVSFSVAPGTAAWQPSIERGRNSAPPAARSTIKPDVPELPDN